MWNVRSNNSKNERQIDDSLKALNLNWTNIWSLKFEVKRWKVRAIETKCKPSSDSNVRKQWRFENHTTNLLEVPCYFQNPYLDRILMCHQYVAIMWDHNQVVINLQIQSHKSMMFPSNTYMTKPFPSKHIQSHSHKKGKRSNVVWPSCGQWLVICNPKWNNHIQLYRNERPTSIYIEMKDLPLSMYMGFGRYPCVCFTMGLVWGGLGVFLLLPPTMIYIYIYIY
jgi:hypothetical protein